MNIGPTEVIIVVVIIIVLFGLGRVLGDKRYSKRLNQNGATTKDQTSKK